MSLGINQRSCVVCEPMAFNQLIPLFAKQMPDMSPPDLLQYRKRPKYAEGGTWSPWIDCTEDQAKDYMNLSSSWLYEVRQLRLIPGANP